MMFMRVLAPCLVCAVLTGCQAPMPMVEAPIVGAAPEIKVPRYLLLGNFVLGGDTPTIDALLEKFERVGPNAFMAKGLGMPVFEVAPGRAWCDLSFKSGIVYYEFGVQFIQPSEPGGNVVAVIRNMQADGYPVNYRVMEVAPDVYAALLYAQAMGNAQAAD
ncbi:hypothetical protein D3C76_1079040 [compost metagenome]